MYRLSDDARAEKMQSLGTVLDRLEAAERALTKCDRAHEEGK